MSPRNRYINQRANSLLFKLWASVFRTIFQNPLVIQIKNHLYTLNLYTYLYHICNQEGYPLGCESPYCILHLKCITIARGTKLFQVCSTVWSHRGLDTERHLSSCLRSYVSIKHVLPLYFSLLFTCASSSVIIHKLFRFPFHLIFRLLSSWRQEFFSLVLA